MKSYPERDNFWWTVGEMVAILVAYFTIQFAISAENIAWLLEEVSK
mgnify:CR=1 FL=1